jgi:lysozyme
MIVNEATLDLIKEFEGFKAEAYLCPAGIWTIGYGTTASAGVGITPKAGMKITKAQAEKYLKATLEGFSKEIVPYITAPINENEFGAFISLAYNIGPSAFKKSTALKRFNAGDKKGAANAILMWNKAGGKVLKGLVRRREAEKKLFLTSPNGAPKSTEEKAERDSIAQSKTMQASAVQVVSGAGAGIAAVGSLSGTAQVVALVLAGIVVLAALWVMRERLRAWSEGWK